MDIHQPKPRVNGSQISNFIGSYVTVVGRTQGSGSVGARTLKVETGDKQQLIVNFQQPLIEPLSLYIELIGRVEPDCSLSVIRFVNWGDDFDLEAYDQLVQIMPQFPTIFPTS